MNKICTSIKQSHKLIDLGIDISTSDMRYGYVAPYDFSDRMYEGGYDPIPYHKDFFIKNPMFSMEEYDGELYAWSLTALLGLMPKLYEFEDDPDDGDCQPNLCKGWNNNNLWHMVYRSTTYITEWYKDPIDAAYEMVVWLLENKKL